MLHIDGDAFFASCEQSRDPALKGRPVITGLERGIASSMSYEAKALGITRAMALHDIRRLCPDAVILPSDYETYSLLSKRFYTIVRRYTPFVEEYGIDECFADLTDCKYYAGLTPLAAAEALQKSLTRELGFTFSLGLASTKVLTKIASKHNKPHGLVVINQKNCKAILSATLVEKLWGVGPATTRDLHALGIRTAQEFAAHTHEWAMNHFSRPISDIHAELNGESRMELMCDTDSTPPLSIQKIKTFTPPSHHADFIRAQMMKNLENACIKARRRHVRPSRIALILRSSTFAHTVREIILPYPSSHTHELISLVAPICHEMIRPHTLYRATGITLLDLKPDTFDQPSLFVRARSLLNAYRAIDALAKKYGKHTVHFGASHLAHVHAQHEGSRGNAALRSTTTFRGERGRKRIGIPMWIGDVK